MKRVIAIDWSGATAGARRKIWLAEAANGRVTRLEGGRDRGEIEQLLLDERLSDPNMVVGLDFAFSMPAWFLREQGFDTAAALWARLAAGEGEEWLTACEPPFWGRRDKPRPACDAERAALRRCEAATGAKSVFQIGGAGSVGTGSLRGMPMLHRLRAAGARVWPFDDAGSPTLIEIYPRLLTGRVRKSSRPERVLYIDRWLAGVAAGGSPHHLPLVRFTRDMLDAARGSEDAFDALFSAIAMWSRIDELASLPPAVDDRMRLEGEIWGVDHGGQTGNDRRRRQ